MRTVRPVAKFSSHNNRGEGRAEQRPPPPVPRRKKSDCRVFDKRNVHSRDRGGDEPESQHQQQEDPAQFGQNGLLEQDGEQTGCGEASQGIQRDAFMERERWGKCTGSWQRGGGASSVLPDSFEGPLDRRPAPKGSTDASTASTETDAIAVISTATSDGRAGSLESGRAATGAGLPFASPRNRPAAGNAFSTGTVSRSTGGGRVGRRQKIRLQHVALHMPRNRRFRCATSVICQGIGGVAGTPTLPRAAVRHSPMTLLPRAESAIGIRRFPFVEFWRG